MNDIQFIQIKGARTNNLKNIDINIPKNQLVVITGLSGSGKSSLAFDTIFSEGQRRFVEALSFNNQLHFEHLPKPDVDSIVGLSPTISLSQTNINRNPKSTVATITDIYNYLKILFVRIGRNKDGNKTLLEPNHFSFNSPYGVCLGCKGKGVNYEIEPTLVLNQELSINQGAILPWQEEKGQYYDKLIQKISQDLDFDLDQPVKELNEYVLNQLLNGISDKKFKISYKNYLGKYRTRTVQFDGILSELKKKYDETPSNSKKEKLKKYMIKQKCRECNGYKLNRNSLDVRVANLHIGEINQLSIGEAINFFNSQLQEYLNSIEMEIANLIIDEIKKRLFFINKVGLSYLSLDRSIVTLSGGEIQRLRLARQISSDMSGIVYVLDEPSIGLHQKDSEKLIEMLKKLVIGGNTVIVVEHDEEIMLAADYLIDIGPKVGVKGGEIQAEGTPNEIIQKRSSITGQYLSGEKSIPLPKKRRSTNQYIELYNCVENNLKNIDVKIPIGIFTVVTGVSGSGKSTLINNILIKALTTKKVNNKIEGFNNVKGIEKIGKTICVTQSPIGRTPRSTPATYTGIFDDVRELFECIAKNEKSNYRKGDFSFNNIGGRCEECNGEGYLKIDLGFTSDLYVECPECIGSRYKKDILQILYNNKSIADILTMSVEDAIVFFYKEEKIVKKLQSLMDVGLGYLKLGQPSTTLSGGEAQRIKLASYLHQQDTKNNIFIFDEPTTGLHMHDISRLVSIFERLVNNGNSVIVIEHNLDIVKCADYIIDLGPEGGSNGGNIVAEGTPEEVIEVNESLTGKYLKMKMNDKRKSC